MYTTLPKHSLSEAKTISTLESIFKQAHKPSLEWGRSQDLNPDDISKIFDDPTEFYENIYDLNIHTEHEIIHEWKESFVKDNLDLIFPESQDLDETELIQEALLILEEKEFFEELHLEYDFKTLFDLNGSVEVRVQLTRANGDDSLPSFWSMSNQGGYHISDPYLSKIIEVLQLDPISFCQILGQNKAYDFAQIQMDSEFIERYQSPKQSVASEQDLFVELENTCNEFNQFVFVGLLDLNELIKAQTISKIRIPKGNNCGLFDPYNGGGSVIEIKLKEDVIINLGTEEDSSTRWELIYDRSTRMSIDDVYGPTRQFWGNQLDLIN